MSASGLTSMTTSSGGGTGAGGGATDISRFSDSENEDNERSPSARSPSDILSGVYRGIKKITPGRDDLAKLTRQPSTLIRQPSSHLALKVFPGTTEKAATSAPLPVSRSHYHPPQHARSLSLQSSLEKPLPEPPPPSLSPASPLTPVASQIQASSLATILDSDGDMDSRTSTMDSSSSAEQAGQMLYGVGGGSQQLYGGTGGGPGGRGGGGGSNGDMSSSQAGVGAAQSRPDPSDDLRDSNLTPKSNGPLSAGPSPQVAQSRSMPSIGAAGAGGAQGAPSAHLSGLMCNVHRTTGREPHPLVGATTTIVGDKLFVFGGRVLSRSRPASLTSDLYELDLVRRHWSKLETTGDVPPPRYFHSMCPLGDSKMVCYGGMSPTSNPISGSPQDQQQQQQEVVVMSDIYIYDVPTRKWTFIQTQDAPQGRYAHCACILPSSATFSSHKAPLSALQHNPSTGANEGRIGVSIDGSGGAEMVVVGGQDGANHYIEQISVFNLRSLKWVSTQSLGKSCGAYRSVVAPLPPSVTARIGSSSQRPEAAGGISQEAREPGSSMLIYSNYNFLDVKLELQIRSSDGTLSEKPMTNSYSPPGLRFPNGGVIDTYFVVSGTYLTSSKQEYALWALDLRNLTWTRIDAGGSVFSQGSWNRGILWNRRNTFVILGNRKRSLVDDYNHRRINFSNVCMVELEAFGFYDNPRKTSPMSGFVSASTPFTAPSLSLARKAGCSAGGRYHSRMSEELGEKALAMRELADMDILCIGGERIPVNSRIVARRWGPFLVQLMREGSATQDAGGPESATAAMMLRSAAAGSTSSLSSSTNMRSSTFTITPSSRNTMESTMSTTSSSAGKPPSTPGTSLSGGSMGAMSPPPLAQQQQQQQPASAVDPATINATPTPRSLPPNGRPRCLYMPHTFLTVQALLHFLYTSSLPPPSSPLCTPQILCSLLQIARPYRVDGLLEAVVERLHGLLDNRNAAAVFNATAMAAGGGRGTDGTLNPTLFVPSGPDVLSPVDPANAPPPQPPQPQQQQQQQEQPAGSDAAAATATTNGGAGRTAGLKLNTAVSNGARPASEELSAATSVSGSEWSSEKGDNSSEQGRHEVWSGELSSVIGLQKRGLRGLMEGRRMRERTGTNSGGMSALGRVGLGIASGGP